MSLTELFTALPGRAGTTPAAEDRPDVMEAIELPSASQAVFALGEVAAYEGLGALASERVGIELIEIERIGSAKPEPGGDKPGGGNGGGGGGGKPGGGQEGSGTYISGDAAVADSLEFNVQVNYSGFSGAAAALLTAFTDAADFFSSLILGDVADVFARGRTIDDIVIEAALTEIDGPGNVLGQAGPTAARTATWLPTTAIMEFDIADAQTYADQGLWDDIVFHEMAHALGFGTLWDRMGLVEGTVADGNIRFTGALANSFYETDFAAIDAADGFDFGIPVETDGGSGTAGGHWDDVLFGNEMMTGYISGTPVYISRMTMAAFEDMGYDTVFDDPDDPFDLFGAIPDDPLAG